MEIRIGSSVNEYLILDVLGRKRPDLTDNSTLNWLDVNASICVGGFTGKIRQDLYTDELYWFEQKLENLFNTLNGEAVLDAMEKWIYLKFEGDGKGHVACSGEVTDRYDYGNVLKFNINLDQTYLPNIINGLKELLETYPVFGLNPQMQAAMKLSLSRKIPQ